MTWIDLLSLAWPLVTGLASIALHVVEARFPRASAVIRATGLDIPAAVRALRPSPKAPPMSSENTPPDAIP